MLQSFIDYAKRLKYQEIMRNLQTNEREHLFWRQFLLLIKQIMKTNVRNT